MPKKEKNLPEEKLVEKNLKDHINELAALYEVSKSITSSVNLEEMLGLIVRKVASIVRADVCMIHLTDNKDIVVNTACGPKRDIARLKKKLPTKGNVISAAIRRKKPIRLDRLRDLKGDIFCSLAKRSGLRSIMVVPLVKNNKAIGALTCLCKSDCAYDKGNERDLALFANQAAMAIENAKLFEEIKINYLNTMMLLVSFIDAKDAYTENHSESVMRLALGIAEALKLPGKSKFIIKYASLLHDLGKVGVDIKILKKPKPLTREEWQQMEKHPAVGADIIKKAGFLGELVPAISYHHVRYAGGGYPKTDKKRDSIPIEARVLAVADAYESMTSDRPYRKHMSKEFAAAELKKYSGTQFDPKVVKTLLTFLKR